VDQQRAVPRPGVLRWRPVAALGRLVDIHRAGLGLGPGPGRGARRRTRLRHPARHLAAVLRVARHELDRQHQRLMAHRVGPPASRGRREGLRRWSTPRRVAHHRVPRLVRTRHAAGRLQRLDRHVFAAPYLNEAGESLAFTVEGDLRADKPVHPKQFARDLVRLSKEITGCLGDLDWPELDEPDPTHSWSTIIRARSLETGERQITEDQLVSWSSPIAAAFSTTRHTGRDPTPEWRRPQTRLGMARQLARGDCTAATPQPDHCLARV
jgi:hypothetical protein